MAAKDSCSSALVSNMCCSIVKILWQCTLSHRLSKANKVVCYGIIQKDTQKNCTETNIIIYLLFSTLCHFFSNIQHSVVFLNVILLSVALLKDILLSVILSKGILLNGILLSVILMNGILLNVILMNGIFVLFSGMAYC